MKTRYVLGEDGDYYPTRQRKSVWKLFKTKLGNAFRGPVGYTGATGATGAMGPPGAPGIMEVVGLYEGARVQIWDKDNLRWSGTLRRVTDK